LHDGHGGEAAQCFVSALGVARRQEARWWELRAATSLCQLWAEGGERRKAHDTLALVYGRFTEGFDTPDLRDAKALLDALR
jgi:predicted ATPase